MARVRPAPVGRPSTSHARSSPAEPDGTRADHDGRHEVHDPDEVGHERGGRPPVDLDRAPDLLDHPAVHHHDPVRDRERLLLVVSDHDRRHPDPPLELPDLVPEVDPHLRVERRQGLVQEEQARRGREGARERDALLLSSRQLGRILVALLRQADHLEELAHPGPDLRPRRARVLETVGDVLRGGEVGEQRVGLEDDPEVSPGGREHRDVAARLLDAARSSGGPGPRSPGGASSSRTRRDPGSRRTRPRGRRGRCGRGR